VIGRNPTRPESFLVHLGAGDWRKVVEAAARSAEALVPQLVEDAEVDRLVARIARTDRDLSREVEEAVLGLAASVLERAAVLGFALARTWPTAPDELDGWPRRALAFAEADSETDRVRTLGLLARPSGETAGDVIRESGDRVDGAEADRVGMVDLGVGDLIGPDWVSATAWPPDLTAPEGTRRVKQWCRRAYEHAGSLALDGGPRAPGAR
jgi:hypothetical protein